MQHYPSICFDRFKMPEFSIATADLCFSEDMSTYGNYIKGKKYFSYHEVMILLDYLNGGCPVTGYWFDIPTDEEFEQIIAKYGHKDGTCHSYHLATALGMGFYGSIGILTDLENYNKDPQKFVYSQALGYGTTGQYWCKGTGGYKGQASAICLNSCGEPSFCRDFTDHGDHIGLSVRLVARPF